MLLTPRHLDYAYVGRIDNGIDIPLDIRQVLLRLALSGDTTN